MLSDEDKDKLVDIIEKIQRDIWGIIHCGTILPTWVRDGIRHVLDGMDM
jgi:hypothetical protein